MFSKFNLQIVLEEEFAEYHQLGESYYNEHHKELQSELSSFIGTDGKIDGTKLQENWFSTKTKFDVFLSHSHQDEKLAISLAGFLKKEMGLSTFIDSCLWSYSNDLLKEIDNNYCIHSNGTSYDYDKRNYSTSHVHMMLSIALMNMIDKCESIFFLNTPKSISLAENIKKEQTMSPWIFHELSAVSTVRQTPLRRYRQHIAKFSEELRHGIYENAASLQITYDVDKLLKKLLPLSVEELENSKDDWKKNLYGLDSALDYLYMSKGIVSIK